MRENSVPSRVLQIRMLLKQPNSLLLTNSPILEPHLHDAHIQPRVLGELLPDVARGLGAAGVRALQRLQLLGRDGGARPLARRVAVQGALAAWGRWTLVEG